MKEKDNLLKIAYRALRRYSYWFFKRDYVFKQIALRKGKCGMHGCCGFKRFIFFLECKHFDKKTKLCKVWNKPGNVVCKRIYPFDEKDKNPETREYCNFYWEKDKKK
jgi:hypothetical protein